MPYVYVISAGCNRNGLLDALKGPETRFICVSQFVNLYQTARRLRGKQFLRI